MADTLKFCLVLMISLAHVHLSANTVDNGLNPVTIWGLFLCSLTDDYDCGMLQFGYVLQCCVTALAAYFILEWRNKQAWIFAFLTGLVLITLYYSNSYLDMDWALLDEGESNIADRYYKLYGYGRALELVLVYSCAQLLFISIYYLCDRYAAFRNRCLNK